MSAAPAPPRPPHRWLGWLLSRKFWLVVGAVVVAALAVYGLAAVPVGPFAFHFTFVTSTCECEHSAFVNHTFPNHASVSMSFVSQYFGNAAEYVLLVTNPAGVVIIYAVMEWGYSSNNFTGPGVNYANVSETFTTTSGGAFQFELLGTEPDILPPVTAWINGTYNAPTL